MPRAARPASRPWSATRGADLDTWAALVARSIRAAGGRRGDLVHIAYGYGLFTGGLGAHYGAELLGCTVVPMSGGQTHKQVQLICDLKPDLIMVTPSYMLVIAEEFLRQGLDPARTSLRAGMFGAEPWSEALRAQIESRCALAALDIYGLSEIMGPGVASECVESKDGPVIWEDHFYPEIVGPGERRGAARRHRGRAGVHHAHQGGTAVDPLPHARSECAATHRPAALHARPAWHRIPAAAPTTC